MPEVQMYDDKGQLTLDGMKMEHAAGRSVIWTNGAGKPIVIRPGEQLPNEAEMARGKPEQEAAVRKALEGELARIAAQLQTLGTETRVSYAMSGEQLTGNLPGRTAIHPDMVGAYPPQRGDGAQPVEPQDVAPEDRALNSSEGQPGLPAEAPTPSEQQQADQAQEQQEAAEDAKAAKSRKG